MNEAKQKAHSFADKVRKRQRDQLFRNRRLQLNQQQHPLSSIVLQKFWDISHEELWKYIPQIQNAIIDNIALLQDDNDRQQQLANDLLYLVMEHSQFTMPKTIKFIRNGSVLVASLVSLVSTDIMPEQLAYWMDYMCDEDKQIVYLGVMSQNYPMAWINHPKLRNNLVDDFMKMQSAAKAVKQLVGYRRISCNRLKSLDGTTLQALLCQIMEKQFESMKQINEKILKKQHMETAIWVLYQNWGQPLCKNLHYFLNKAIINGPEQLSPVFIKWICQALQTRPQLINCPNLKTILKYLSSQMSDLDMNQSSKTNKIELINKLYQKQLKMQEQGIQL